VTRGSSGAALPFILTWSLYAGVSGPQGTDSCKAYGLQWRGFRLLEKLNSQLSFEPRSCHLEDRTGGIHDPGDTRQRDPG
jgi:hypothetical protein